MLSSQAHGGSSANTIPSSSKVCTMTSLSQSAWLLYCYSLISFKEEFLLGVQGKDFLFPGIDGLGNMLFHLCSTAIVWAFKGDDLKKRSTKGMA